jgi:serine/threonine protein kinase/Tfp pilus assembly protein PilF
MIGKSLSHYRILEKIASGGMGVVYRAMDDHLDRCVALKVLPDGAIGDDAARRRFRREAMALSRLNHANIAAIYDFDTQGVVDFLVMEYVPGLSLAQRIQAGSIGEELITRLGVQLAEALVAAHEQGVIHRDVKPGNVIVTPKGNAKVLDFGLAKFLRPLGSTPTPENLTKTGNVVGTLPYMAPEALLGSELDARCDIYSTGVILYEMATGRRPFPETQVAVLVEAILHRAPIPPRQVNSQISRRLELVILNAMDRELSRRYQCASELEEELRRCGTQSETVTAVVRSARSTIGRIESIAVLPLANLSGEPGQEYFTDGMTEALTADLAQIRALRVVSRTSVMRYKGVSRPLPEIARELRVDALVEGSVLRSGDRVRITAQLIEAATDRHLWAKSYERDLRDILQLQSEVARAIAQEIRIKITPQEEERLTKTRRVDPVAYEAYLKGRQYWNKRNAESLRKGIACFHDAIERDPTYPLAHVGLADSYLIAGFYSDIPPKDTFPKAKAAARRALELDDTLAEAYAPLALANSLYDWDAPAAERNFQRAIELNPGHPTAHHWFAEHLSAMGRLDQAITESMQALELDPLSSVINSCVGWILYRARRFEEAALQLRMALEWDRNFLPALYYLSLAHLQMSSPEDGVRVSERIVEFLPESGMGKANLARAYAAAGMTDRAHALLAEVTNLAKRQYVHSYFIAKIHLALKDYDQTLDWLEKARAERSPWLAWLNVEPLFDSLREHPRFREIARSAGPLAELQHPVSHA